MFKLQRMDSNLEINIRNIKIIRSFPMDVDSIDLSFNIVQTESNYS